MGLKAVLIRWLGGVSRDELSQIVDLTREDAPGTPNEGAPVPDDLVTSVRKLESELASVRLEWAEVLDKITAWANRQAARDRVKFRKALGDRPTPEDELDEAEPVGQGMRAELNGVEHPPMPAAHRHPKADLYQRIRRGR